MSREGSERDLPELLHDARLCGGTWHVDLASLSLRWTPLRRGSDGTPLADPSVDLRLSGVAAIVISYDPFWFEESPSQLVVDEPVQSSEPWPFPEAEIPVSIDSPQDDEDRALAAWTDWIVGTSTAAHAARHRLVLEVSQPPVLRMMVTIAFDQFNAFSAGATLDLHVWADQYDAWWQGCREHWDAQKTNDEDDMDDQDAAYEVAIPAGDEDGPTPDYQPPAEPVFDLEPTDAPPDLLEPISAWFEANEEGKEDGNRVYARAVDAWWIEGARAYARIVGVEHFAPVDGEPAENRIEQWGFDLRRARDLWRIRNRSSGGDLDIRAAPAWVARWRSGTIDLRIDDE